MDVVMRILHRTVVVFIVVIIHERPRLSTYHQGVATIAYFFAAGTSTGSIFHDVAVAVAAVVLLLSVVVVMFVNMVRRIQRLGRSLGRRCQSAGFFHCIE